MYPYGVPTPCTAAALFPPKRPMDEALCERFHKRLRLDGSEPHGYSPQAPTPSASSAASGLHDGGHAALCDISSAAAYGQVNRVLQHLHGERLARSRSFDSGGIAPAAEIPMSCQATADRALPASPIRAPQANSVLQSLHAEQLSRRMSMTALCDMHGVSQDGAQMEDCPAEDHQFAHAARGGSTNFTLSDIVLCQHAAGGRCLQCSGRRVQNIPLELYGHFCMAYGGSSLASRSCSQAAWLRTELSLPSLASLIAILSPEPGERLLHLGSGLGCAVAVWAMLLPSGQACGIENNPLLHRAAESAAHKLLPEIRQRMFIHCGDVLGSGARGEWRQANVIFVGAACLNEDAQLERLIDGFHSVQPGTRVVALSRPLCREPSKAPSGFALARETIYRTAGGSNSTVYIYRRMDAS